MKPGHLKGYDEKLEDMAPQRKTGLFTKRKINRYQIGKTETKLVSMSAEETTHMCTEESEGDEEATGDI